MLEVLAGFLIVQNNYFHRASFINSSNFISGYIYDTFSSITEYFSLKDANKALADENARLRNSLKSAYKANTVTTKEVKDSTYSQYYTFIPAKVINNSTSRADNYITLNVGIRQGIRPDMGVICPDGVVGVVKNVSSNFCSVISVLNSNLKVSTKIKKNGFFGSLVWDGYNYSRAKLNEIPVHVKITPGDTLITSGYSAIFPEGIAVGNIIDFNEVEGGNFYEIKVKLSTNFKNLSYVYVVNNIFRDELDKVEKIQ